MAYIHTTQVSHERKLRDKSVTCREFMEGDAGAISLHELPTSSILLKRLVRHLWCSSSSSSQNVDLAVCVCFVNSATSG